jgi:hypothetical protein
MQQGRAIVAWGGGKPGTSGYFDEDRRARPIERDF